MYGYYGFSVKLSLAVLRTGLPHSIFIIDLSLRKRTSDNLPESDLAVSAIKSSAL